MAKSKKPQWFELEPPNPNWRDREPSKPKCTDSQGLRDSVLRALEGLPADHPAMQRFTAGETVWSLGQAFDPERETQWIERVEKALLKGSSTSTPIGGLLDGKMPILKDRK